jgi:hypothetical protein
LPRRPKRRRQIFEVAEADLELDAGFCPCERRAGMRKSLAELVDANDRRSGVASVASRAAS